MFSGAVRPLFMTIEGTDFSGKSTLARNLRPLFSRVSHCFTREPGGSPVAERLREVLLDPELDMDPCTEAYLYASARADHVRHKIRPCLESWRFVVCERFLDSSLAYQGYGRGLGVAAVRALNARAVEEVRPDLTFYLRLSSEERARRAQAADAPLDRIERMGSEFMQRVEEGFEELAASEPDRIKVLDAARPPEELAEMVGKEILDLPEVREVVRSHVRRHPRQ